MFLFKKVMAPLFYPVPLCLELLSIGLVLLWFTRKQIAGKILVSIGSILLALLSYEGVSGALLETLESRYPPLRLPQLQAHSANSKKNPIKWIVVLAGGTKDDPTLPIQSQISEPTRIRLLEGIRIHNLLPGSKLILTGGVGFQAVPEATIISRVAQTLGVRKDDMVLEVKSRDTKDHPHFVAPIVKEEPFILVTSAFHMPRAMQLFVKQGLYPIPAPAGHRTVHATPPTPAQFFPGPDGLLLAGWAIHEYLGLLWAWIQGQV